MWNTFFETEIGCEIENDHELVSRLAESREQIGSPLKIPCV